MSNFLKSFTPLLRRLKLKKYFLEIILLTIAVVITVAASVLYAKNSQNLNEEIEISPTRLREDYGGQEKIYVDVSGAVNKPNIYQVNFGARIKDVIDKAGGLSDEADVMFFNRNFNFARIVIDQEKIYIPSIAEINNGLFVQSQRTLDYVSPITDTGIVPIEDNNQLINLNSATIEELDQLPGIGQVTANKIISNRPYATLEELLTKKIVNRGVFEKIKSLITL